MAFSFTTLFVATVTFRTTNREFGDRRSDKCRDGELGIEACGSKIICDLINDAESIALTVVC